MRRIIIGIVVSVLLILAGTATAATAAAEIPVSEVKRFLMIEMEFSPAGAMRMWTAIHLAITEHRLQTVEALSFLTWLDRASGPRAIKEEIGLVIAATLEDKLPVVQLLSRTNEWLARGIHLHLILQAITQQKEILSGVRDLLEERGIFIIGAREEEREIILLSRRQFDLVVMHIADALQIYLAARGDPRHVDALYNTAAKRLIRLSAIEIIPTLIVDLILRRIDGEALSEMVLAVPRINRD
ncbi:hypothetical protein LM599_01685 [Candidatus Acetothermia bacterium]|jgi:hypothetical protein|nr:hypothetical protein [Candidatus Acetothermia bacterium]MCI2427549.1 hypothetical protein [Candidatus Acetothermia bacterium]MCI2428406.1 hypothetical protein [Candidatus Acetothermia bacterium]